ncbi:ABC transporter ATP-binding protein [Desulforapulum autotrophicum]|nr:ABC transporter ATP-binding protein [Desulforapulum autotrophicum]
MIKIKSVKKTFKSDIGRPEIKAVQGISLQVDKGQIFGIIGPNGAGKSTLLKMILGFAAPNSGSIKINGLSPLDPESRDTMGYLPENPYYYDHLTTDELLLFCARTASMDKENFATRANQLLEITGLTEARRSKLSTYSKGMTQRAGLCFALIHDPDIVILDEPMSGLDPIGRKMVFDLIIDLKEKGKTVLFCSHILTDVEKLCDAITIMAKGKVKKQLTKAEISEDTRDLETIFLEAVSQTLPDTALSGAFL